MFWKVDLTMKSEQNFCYTFIGLFCQLFLREYTESSDENWGPKEISEFINHIKEQLSDKIDSINTKVLEQQELLTSK